MIPPRVYIATFIRNTFNVVGLEKYKYWLGSYKLSTEFFKINLYNIYFYFPSKNNLTQIIVRSVQLLRLRVDRQTRQDRCCGLSTPVCTLLIFELHTYPHKMTSSSTSLVFEKSVNINLVLGSRN